MVKGQSVEYDLPSRPDQTWIAKEWCARACPCIHPCCRRDLEV